MAGPKATALNTPKAVPASGLSTLTPSLDSLWKSYDDTTHPRLKLIDALLVFLMLSGIVQFLYCILVTNYPFNAFLSGWVHEKKKSWLFLQTQLGVFCRFASTVGQFVLAASLRSQVNPENKEQFKEVSPERLVPMTHHLLLQCC